MMLSDIENERYAEFAAAANLHFVPQQGEISQWNDAIVGFVLLPQEYVNLPWLNVDHAHNARHCLSSEAHQHKVWH